ncbi:MAG: WecB/TagA/CpsF family glycosyltransferase [Planctomycetota bacterium]
MRAACPVLPEASKNIPTPADASFDTVELRGVGFASLTQTQTVGLLFSGFDAGRGGWLITSNLDHLRRATRDPEFRAMLDQADAVVADGMPLVWASKLAGTPLPERVAGSTMTTQIAAEAAQRGRSVFLLGGNPGIAEAAQAAMEADHPGIRVVGTHCPPLGFESQEAEMAAIRDVLNAAQPDLVLVALGSPKQEKLIRDLRGAGLLPGAWWIGVGITLSFLCGDVDRAPGWMQRFGLEWIHRLTQEPKRLFRRYLVEGVPFALGLLVGSVIIRVIGKRAPQPAVSGGKD